MRMPGLFLIAHYYKECMFCEHTAYDREVHDDAETDVRQILHHEHNERR